MEAATAQVHTLFQDLLDFRGELRGCLGDGEGAWLG